MITGDLAEALFLVWPESILRDGVLTMPWHIAAARSERIAVLGRVCDTHGCAFLAAFATIWPGQPGVHCPRCTHRLAEVAVAMGFDLPTRDLDVPLPRFGDDDASVRFSLLELR